MGVLDQVSIEQEDFRDLLQQEAGSGGPTLEEESVQGAAKRYGEDTVVNLSVSLSSLFGPEVAKQSILRDSVAILDHLDTLGMEIKFKR